MKHKLLISIGVVSFFGLLLFIPQGNAAEQFVTDFWTQEIGNERIKICWTVADTVENSEPGYPQVEYYPSDIDGADHVYSSDVTVVSDTSHCFITTSLADGTKYGFWVKYKGSNLSSYADYIGGDTDSVTSALYSQYTRNSNAKFASVDKSYVMPGETVRLNGTRLGSGPSTLTDKVGVLFGGDYSVFGPDSGYEFKITKWTDKYIEFTVPEYNSSMSVQSGRLYLENLIIDEDNYNSDISIKLITNETEVDRAIASGYQGSEYRYLLNASRYRYNIRRTTSTFAQEQVQMEWVSDYLTSIGKGIDATWSLVLAYGRVYGDYSEEEIKKEIKFGPGCIHAVIPQSAWSKTDSYGQCMSHTL